PKAIVNTARPKAVLNAVKGNEGNPQMNLQEKGVIDSECSRHVTENMSYVTDYEEIDGGYVAFGGNPKGEKITGKEDAPIKGRSINEREAAAKRINNDSEEIIRVLTSIDAATVLAGGIDVPTGSGFIPTAGPPATVISTSSEVGPTASPIVTKRKGKEVMVESDTPKKKKLQEQIDAQVARELEKQQEKESMRMNEQIARDAEVTRIHAEEELQGMIDSL
nr:ribonuclease H-like domain-containing protein [Tanacetum cinerariifolium]